MQDAALVAQLSLGILFLCSGVLKLRDWRGLVVGVVEYDVLPVPLARLAARLLPVVEVGLGLSLLAGKAQQVTGVAAGLLILGFAWGVGLNVIRGRSLACHCFGGRSDEMLGRGTLFRLAGMFALALTASRAHPTLLDLSGQDAVPLLALAGSMDLLLFLLPNLSAPVRTWMTKVSPSPTLRGGCVSFRNQPLPAPRALPKGDASTR